MTPDFSSNGVVLYQWSQSVAQMITDRAAWLVTGSVRDERGYGDHPAARYAPRARQPYRTVENRGQAAPRRHHRACVTTSLEPGASHYPRSGHPTAHCSSCAATEQNPPKCMNCSPNARSTTRSWSTCPRATVMSCSISAPWRRSKTTCPRPASYYASDLSMKRNIGLVLARMLRWQRIFFLDDDIRDINPPDVHETVAMLGHSEPPGCGWRIFRTTQWPAMPTG